MLKPEKTLLRIGPFTWIILWTCIIFTPFVLVSEFFHLFTSNDDLYYSLGFIFSLPIYTYVGYSYYKSSKVQDGKESDQNLVPKKISEKPSLKELISKNQLVENSSENKIFIDFMETVSDIIQSIPDSLIGSVELENLIYIHEKMKQSLNDSDINSKIEYYESVDKTLSEMSEEWIKLFSQSSEFDVYKKMGDWVRDKKIL